MLSAVSLQDLERFAMVSCAVLSKDALPVVQELLQAAREAKQLLCAYSDIASGNISLTRSI